MAAGQTAYQLARDNDAHVPKLLRKASCQAFEERVRTHLQ